MAIELPGLTGTTPVGFLAALGALAAARAVPGAALIWAGELEPRAQLTGFSDVAALIELIDADRQRWLGSPVLQWTPDQEPMRDVKVSQNVLREWASTVLAEGLRVDGDLLCALLAEGALAGTGDSKPTHLHFTTANQHFLDIARHLARALRPDDVEEALLGPWSYTSALPSLRWSLRGERTYAYSPIAPTKTPSTGMPAADWLAFVGLSFLPVVNRNGTLLTTGCDRAWKRGRMHWPLWDAPLTPLTIRSLLSDPGLLDQPASWRRARGINQVLAAPIRRTDQGGYGSFGPTTLVAPRNPPLRPRAGGGR